MADAESGSSYAVAVRSGVSTIAAVIASAARGLKERRVSCYLLSTSAWLSEIWGSYAVAVVVSSTARRLGRG